ncbi:MAG: hypothetical protein R3E50_14160 [Halioglobus sp.]
MLSTWAAAGDISGIWCAKTLGSQVTSVDADPDVFPFLQASAALNGVTTTPLVARFEQLPVSCPASTC